MTPNNTKQLLAEVEQLCGPGVPVFIDRQTTTRLVEMILRLASHLATPKDPNP